MSGREHRYGVRVLWTGNTGDGTAGYRGYDREYRLEAPGKPPILGSADPAFRGDPDRWNPEELFLGALSACHKLWYLHLCAVGGVVVIDYTDEARGVMVEHPDGSGQFTSVTLRPHVTLAADSDAALARHLHSEAHALCFIARSVAVPVAIEPTFIQAAREPPAS